MARTPRVACARCGRSDLVPRHGSTAVPGHVRPARQQRNAWSKEVRVLCR